VHYVPDKTDLPGRLVRQLEQLLGVGVRVFAAEHLPLPGVVGNDHEPRAVLEIDPVFLSYPPGRSLS
jgi:hypothetical protein